MMASEGLFASLQNLTGTLLSIVQTRLELMRVEIEEGRQRLIELLGIAFLALFCLSMGIVLLTILIVVIFWDTHRLLTLSLLTGCFLLIGGFLWLKTLKNLKGMPRMFEASLAEILRDHQKFKPHEYETKLISPTPPITHQANPGAAPNFRCGNIPMACQACYC